MIRRLFLLFIAIGVLAGVWFYPKKVVETKVKSAEGTHLIEVLHFHLPGNPESESLADIFNKVEEKYAGQVLVTRVDIQAEPERAKAEKVTKPPKVVMMAGTVRACKFQGVWSRAQIERKIDEILHGLERMGKDWRPDVQGMQAAPAGAPAAPGGAAKPAPATAPSPAPVPKPAAGAPPGPVPGMTPAKAR